jgi:SAM-dependent methyltransferase
MEWPFEITESDHDIQDPTSPEKIRRLGEYLRLDDSSEVLDLACGKGGPAKILAEQFGCKVTGVEKRSGFAEAGRKRVTTAGLESLIDIQTGDAKAYKQPEKSFDAALCLGAAFVWGHIGDAAAALRPAVRPGGFVVVGEPFWRTWPLPENHAPQSFVDLPATVKRFESPGLQLVGLISSSEQDWDHYESLHWRAIEEWLADGPDSNESAPIHRADQQFRDDYLDFQRELLGWAMFVGRKR